MSRLFRSFGVLVCLLAATPVVAGEFSDDLKARRLRLMQQLSPDTMLVLLSAPSRVYSGDVDYEYRQDSNFYYLTGVTQEDSALILMPGNTTHREFLFVKERNPSQEHWTGRTLSREEARDQTGIETVLPSSAFDAFVGAMLSRRAYAATVLETDAAPFFAALGDGHAKLAVAMEHADGDDPPTRVQIFLRAVRDKYVGFVAVDATPALTSLRLVKTPYELRMLTEASTISADAQIAGMRATHPGVFEYEVKAAIEAVHRARGAVSWAYPSIVGSGPNTTTLHYPSATRKMESGDLVLVDAAANYGYQATDITRTYPVNGKFTAVQREIYDLVLKTQAECIKAATPGATLATIHEKAVDVLKDGLLKLGLITDTSGNQYRMWFTHGTSHFVGIDVHDVGARTQKLEAGMTFTIEPGVYIRQSVIDELPRTPENIALIEKIQPAVTRYKDIGVRVEDSFVMDATGARSLTSGVPKSIDDIEALMRSGNSRRQPSGGR